jgi:two-component system sensor histidine kinase MprB
MLAATAVGLAVALAAISSYVIVSIQLTDQVTSSLQKAQNSIQQELSNPGFGFGDSLARLTNRVSVESGDAIQVIEANGTVLIPTNGASSPVLVPTTQERAVAAEATTNPNAQTIHDGSLSGSPYRILTFPIGTLDGQGVAVMIAYPLNSTDQNLAELKLVLVGAVLAGVALAIGLGLVVARVTIRPVKRLTAAAEHVAATQNLDARIDETGDDELARLGHAFNGMLSALASSRTQQAQLISDAGHELRTPLTSLRTNIEVLMRVRDLPDSDRADLLGDVQAQLEELTTLIGDVVDMARQEEIQPEPTEVRLDELVERAVERARRRNSSLVFDVVLDRGSVRAQPALLERAILNVLDNAAKFSPAGRVVEVRLARSDRWYLDVRDHGPGIAPDDLTRVFDRFYRAPAARALPGSGLGLAIVRQVITSHGGSVGAFLPPGGGTLIHIELPIVAEQEPDVEPTDAEPSGVEPSGVEPSGVEPSGVEPSGMGPSGVGPTDRQAEQTGTSSAGAGEVPVGVSSDR